MVRPVRVQLSLAALLALSRFLATTGDTEALARVSAEMYARWLGETALDD